MLIILDVSDCIFLFLKLTTNVDQKPFLIINKYIHKIKIFVELFLRIVIATNNKTKFTFDFLN